MVAPFLTYKKLYVRLSSVPSTLLSMATTVVRQRTDGVPPPLDVTQLLGSLAVHQSGTASRRMSSSNFGFRPPYDTRSISRPRTCSMSCLKPMKPNDEVPSGASTSRSMSES